LRSNNTTNLEACMIQYNDELKSKLLSIVQNKSVIIKNVTLASGKKSNYYVDGKQTTLSSDGIVIIAKLFADLLTDVQAVGGPTMGADPFVGALLYECHNRNIPMAGFIVRKEIKQHGTMKMIEGPVAPGTEVAVIEDVITTGGSVLKAIEILQENNCTVKKVLALLDREQGGQELFEEKGIPYYPILTKSDLTLPA